MNCGFSYGRSFFVMAKLLHDPCKWHVLVFFLLLFSSKATTAWSLAELAVIAASTAVWFQQKAHFQPYFDTSSLTACLSISFDELNTWNGRSRCDHFDFWRPTGLRTTNAGSKHFQFQKSYEYSAMLDLFVTLSHEKKWFHRLSGCLTDAKFLRRLYFNL